MHLCEKAHTKHQKRQNSHNIFGEYTHQMGEIAFVCKIPIHTLHAYRQSRLHVFMYIYKNIYACRSFSPLESYRCYNDDAHFKGTSTH